MPLFKPKTKNLKEFTFIWYKKLETKGKKIYTQPFRTKVEANTFEEAKEKVINFAMGKMKLIVIPEDQYNETDLAHLEKSFEVLGICIFKIRKSY